MQLFCIFAAKKRHETIENGVEHAVADGDGIVRKYEALPYFDRDDKDRVCRA